MTRAYIVAGLAFGDEGKGATVDYLCRRHDARLIVRYNGGPQASHTVTLPDGRKHSFHQFGSGTFLPEVRTHLSRHMLVEPYALLNEAEALKKVGVADALDRISIDENAIIITPWHWMANRIRELERGENRHGSCGYGIGEARSHQLRGMDFRLRWLNGPNSYCHFEMIRKDLLSQLTDLKNAEAIELRVAMEQESISDLIDFYHCFTKKVQVVPTGEFNYNSANAIVFEGAQGVLLDEDWGFEPYNTWTCTTFSNAINLCIRADIEDITRIGVLRTYFTRHGPGPFPTETDTLNWPDDNVEGPWQGRFRQGWFDMPAVRYAIMACGTAVDYIALTHLDRFPNVFRFCNSYYGQKVPLRPTLVRPLLEDYIFTIGHSENPIARIEKECGIPVKLGAGGPTWRDWREY